MQSNPKVASGMYTAIAGSLGDVFHATGTLISRLVHAKVNPPTIGANLP